MFYIDTHCHLFDERYFPYNDEIIKESINSNVKLLVNCGTSMDDWEKVAVQYKKFPENIVPAFGFHPWYIPDIISDNISDINNKGGLSKSTFQHTFNNNIEINTSNGQNVFGNLENISKKWQEILIEYIVKNNGIVGEIGLDRSINWKEDGKIQEYFFATQLEIAKQLNKVVSVHCRKTFDRLIPIIKKTKISPDKIVIHSFSGSINTLKELIELGVNISFSCSIINKNNFKIKEIIKFCPLEKIFTETDSPDIYPPDLKNGIKNNLEEDSNNYREVQQLKDINYENHICSNNDNQQDFRHLKFSDYENQIYNSNYNHREVQQAKNYINTPKNVKLVVEEISKIKEISPEDLMKKILSNWKRIIE